MLKDGIFFIQESGKPTDLDLLTEDQIVGLNIPVLEDNRKNGRKGGTVFKTILQEAGAVNKNKRIYNKSALDTALKEQMNTIREGNFYGEMDHPTDSNPARFSTVKLSNACFRVLKTDWEGNNIVGVCETLANTPGKDMQALIVENGIKLGFSLRAMGKTNLNPVTGITEVVSPMKMFCYDCVSNPSHANAKMTQVFENTLHGIVAEKDSHLNALMENENQMMILAENYGSNLETLIKGNNVIITPQDGMAIMKIDDTTIRTFIKEDTLSAFLGVKNRFFK